MLTGPPPKFNGIRDILSTFYMIVYMINVTGKLVK